MHILKQNCWPDFLFFSHCIIHDFLLIQENHWSQFMHYFVFLYHRFFPHFLHWFGFTQLNILFVPFSKEIVSHNSCISMVFSIEYSFVPFSKQISSHISCIDMVSLYHGFFLQRKCLNNLLICIWVSSMRSLASAKFIESFFFKILWIISCPLGEVQKKMTKLEFIYHMKISIDYSSLPSDLLCHCFFFMSLLLFLYVTPFSLCHSFFRNGRNQ